MYKRHEAARTKEEFWTTFGKYMAPIPSADGEKISWINYHTRVKDIFFRMDTGPSMASIFISIEHKDSALRHVTFEKFGETRTFLESTLGEQWTWEAQATLDGHRIISRIVKDIQGVSIFNRDHWPELISFFKPRMIALDEYWSNVKYSFM